MKFGIDIGHNCPPDTGSVGVKKEDDLTKAVGTLLIDKLKKAGHTVVDCTPTRASSVTDSLRQRVNKANQANVNLFVSIHFNAFNGQANGSEVFGISNAAQGIATKVLNEIVKLGFRNRGVKGTQFYVLKNTQMPAILVECCFCDARVDMDRFNAEKMAEAIKVGLIGRSPAVDKAKDKEYILEVTKPTVLKPSPEQSEDLPPESLIGIAPGKYPIEDFSFEEGHYAVEWPDKNSPSGRQEDFVFAGHTKVIEK